jgi:3-oxoacyl-[acyl-carrier-protein] synthase-1
MSERRVAIVGMGGAFPTCRTLDEFSHKIFSDKSLVRKWEVAAAHGKKVRSHVSGYVTHEETQLEIQKSDILEDYPDIFTDKLNRIPIENLSTADLGSIWAMLGAQESIKMANWSEDEVTSERTGVVIGSGGGGHEIQRRSWHNFFELGKKTRYLGPHNVDRTMVYRDAANVACLIKSKGVCESIGSACACGLGNIGHAYRLIKFGIQDRVICGGTEGTSLESFIGFDAMQVLSRSFAPEESSRAFDKNRNGFVCSFGCGIIALEEYDTAKARGANVLAVIDGYFNNSDGDGDMFAPSFDGQQRLWAGLKNDVGEKFSPDVVKVHGTSTPAGDAIELLSVVNFLGEDGYHVSAPKSQFGHMLGAAGAVELIVAVLMLQEQKVSPCLNSDELNEDLEAIQNKNNWVGPKKPLSYFRNLIPQKTLSKEINQVVCLNYGFGGTNSSMLISKE